MAFLGNASGSSTSTGSFARVLAADTLHVDGLITQGGVGSGTQNIFIGGDAGGAPNNTGTTRSVIIGAAAASKLTTGDYAVAIGYQAGGATDTATGDHNNFVAIGSSAGSQIKTNASRFVILGPGAGQNAISPSNSVLIGFNAGANAYSGSNNVLIGYQAGFTMGTSAGETPNNNIAIGLSAMEDAGDATYNVAVGDEALKNIIGFNNTAIGKSALNGHINGDGNVAIGAEAMMDAGEDGGVIDNQVAIGSGALKNIDTFGTLYANIAIGQNTAQNVVTSSFNTIMGYRALYSATGVGSANLVIGNSAAYASTGSTFHANVILGDYAGYQTKGKENVLIGEYAGHDLESGQQNVVIGANAARFSNKFQSNTNSVLVGHRTDASADGNSNENVFGYNTTGLGSNTVTLGNASITDVYMASDSGATIHAAGISGSGGNLALIGDISGSATSTGSFGVLQLNKFNAGIGDDSNINIGEGAGSTGASATNNIAIGFGAGAFSNAGSFINIAIGREAQGHWTDADGDRNIAIGYQAMYDHNGGDDNIAIGYQAMKNGEGSGADNIAIGTDAMQVIGAGASRNIGLGDRAQYNLVGGTDNVSVGKDSLFTNVDGDYNVAFGTEALYGINAESADKNVAVGYRAGIFIANGSTQFTDGDSNVFIGSETKPAADDESNQIIIGANAIGKGSNTALIGDDNITDIYMSEDLGAMVHVGNISGSATSTGSFGRVNVNGSGTRMAFNTGTTDGTIDFLAIDDGGTVSKIQLFSDDAGGSTGINMMTDSNFAVSKLNNTTLFKITENSGHVEFPAANQKISGSAASSASFGQLTLKHGTIDAQYGSQVWPGAPTGGGAGNGGFNVKTMAFGSIYIGHDVGLLDDGNNQNVGIGVDVLGANTGGNQLVAIGKDAMRLATGMSGDIAIGIDAMEEAHDTLYNVAIGFGAAKNLGKGSSDSDDNVAIGRSALSGNANGKENVAIGRNAMQNTVSGSQNIAIGPYALMNGTAAATVFKNNVAIGQNPLSQMKSGQGQVAIGPQAMYAAGANGEDLDDNIALGQQSLYSLEKGDNNVAMGYQAMHQMETGSNNVAIGYKALGDSDNSGDGGSADTNVAIGYNALGDLKKGSGNIAIGSNTMNSVEGTVSGNITGNIALGSNVLKNLENGSNAAGFNGNNGGNFACSQDAMSVVVSGSENIAIGYRALYGGGTNKDGGIRQIFLGYTAGLNSDGGRENIAIGYEAGYNCSGDQNAMYGYRAGKAVTTGDQNLHLGTSAGSNLQTGNYNVFIGKSQASATDVNDEIVIAAGNGNVTGAGTETIRIGVDSDHITNDFGENATWTHSSDKRIKKDIEDNTLGLEFINKLKTRTFKKKAPSEYPTEFDGYDAEVTERKNPNRKHYGFVAQEVKEVMDSVGHSEFPVWKENTDGMQELGETELITPLIKAVQELTEMVKAQQKEIEELKK